MEYGVLLCYEPNLEFCYRHIVTGWFEILLDINAPEIKVKDGLIEKTKNLHIKQYLEDEMRFKKYKGG